MATQYVALYPVSPDRRVVIFFLFSLFVCIVGFAANLVASLRIDQAIGKDGKAEADHVAPLSFHESIERYGKTEAGAQLFAELSALEGIQESPLYNRSFDSDDDDDEDNDEDFDDENDYDNNFSSSDGDTLPPRPKGPKPKSKKAMLKQLDEYTRAHPRVVALIPKLKHAVEKVFSDEEPHKRAYASSQNSEEDEKKKDAVILENVLQVIKNLPKEQAELAMKDKKFFAKKLVRGDLDMDDKEFRKTHFGLKRSKDATLLTEIPAFLEIDTFGEKASLLQDGAVSSSKNPQICDPQADECDRRKIENSCENRLKVEDQGRGCGSCWAFAGSHYLALNHCVETGRAINYSEQELLDCSGYACGGGSFNSVFYYIARRNHMSAEADYRYEARRNSCRANQKQSVWTGDYRSRQKYSGEMTKNSVRATSRQWIDMIKKFVAKYGAVVYYLSAGKLRFNSGVAEMCDYVRWTNHATVITGWTRKNGRPVWIMRNSWGDWWNESGYGYIAMENRCNRGLDPIASIQVVPIQKWSDEGSTKDDLVISQTEKKIGIEKGETKTLSCTSGVISIKRAVVASTGSLAYEKSTNIDVAGPCNGRTSCQIHHPQGGGYQGFNTLRILYECKGESPSPSPTPCPCPNPGPSPSPNPGPSPNPNPGPCPNPNPGPSPNPNPGPSPNPNPGPSPNPIPGPSPNPNPGPSPSPNPGPSPNPNPGPNPSPNPGPSPKPGPAPYPDTSYCEQIKPAPTSPNALQWCMMQCKYHGPYCDVHPDGMSACLSRFLSPYFCDISAVKRGSTRKGYMKRPRWSSITA